MKNALTPLEYRFLRTVYHRRESTAIVPKGTMLNETGPTVGYEKVHALIRDLEAAQVLDASPDNLFFKITDLGVDLLRVSLHKDMEWRKPGIARVAVFSRDETIIPAGNQFVAQRWIKEIFSKAGKSLDIVETYIGSDLFDRIHDADIKADIRILTQKCGSSPSYYQAFRKDYGGKIELRNATANVLHARSVIVDRTSGYMIDHSLKDLGKKDAHSKTIVDVPTELQLFEQRWATATAV